MSLIFVPTPLGNLRDITLRALEVLRNCDAIAAEDTRVTRRLLSAHEIQGKPIFRHDRHSPPATLDFLIEKAQTECVVVMSDAGTPGISDPGQELIARARAAEVAIEVLPGGTAFICAAVLSGFPLTPLLFDGFFPRTSGGRKEAIERAMRIGATTVWYESPQRLRDTLCAIGQEAPASQIFVARELTKKFEQQLLGTPAEVLAALPEPLKGEITLVARLQPSQSSASSEREKPLASLDEQIHALLSAGQSVAAVAKALSRQGLGERQELYARISSLQRLKREQT